MKSNELRIGNLVYHRPDTVLPTRVMAIDILAFNSTTSKKIMLYPIPLNEEWLGRFGFKRPYYVDFNYKSRKWTLNDTGFVEDWFYMKYEISYPEKIRMFQAFKCGKKLSSIKYVHQLQNLFFALASEELKI